MSDDENFLLAQALEDENNRFKKYIKQLHTRNHGPVAEEYEVPIEGSSIRVYEKEAAQRAVAGKDLMGTTGTKYYEIYDENKGPNISEKIDLLEHEISSLEKHISSLKENIEKKKNKN